ncbi:MAG: PAS domain S-box protein [Mariprofundales bacterium]
MYNNLLKSVSIIAPNAHIVANIDGGIIAANPATSHIFGFTHQEILAGNIGMFMPEPHKKQHNKFIKDYIKLGHSAMFGQRKSLLALRKSGEVFPIAIYLGEISINNTRVFVAIIEDISLQEQISAKMHDQEQHMRKLSQALEQSGEGILITDANGLIEYINPAFSRITGYGAAEALGQNPSIIKSSAQDPSFYVDLWQTITNGEMWHGKLIDRRKDGGFYPALTSISPIFDDNGKICNYIASQRDISHEQELEENLRQAQKMEAIGTLVGGIAHDFNNMLAGILGNVYLAKTDASDRPDLLEYLSAIDELGNRAADIIQQLLTFARKDMVQLKRISLAPFLKESLKLISKAVPENIRLDYSLAAAGMDVEADATQLQQILMNLINNARDALEGIDNARILVSLKKFIADKEFFCKHPQQVKIDQHFVCLRVQDNGHGIASERIDKIFDPFFTTKAKGKGTGLGLAMVYGSVQRVGGIIEVESTVNKGTCFVLYFPLLEQNNIKNKNTREKSVQHGNGELILVADDAPHLRQIMQRVLTRIGYNVLLAKDGLQATELFCQYKKDIALVILDIVMPNRGGVETAHCIRKIASNMPLIFSTGYDSNEFISDGIFVDCPLVNKPFRVERLSRLVHKIIKESQNNDK